MLASHHANTTAVKTFQEYKASSKTAALPLFHRENAQIVFDQQGAEEHWAALNPDTAHIKTCIWVPPPVGMHLVGSLLSCRAGPCIRERCSWLCLRLSNPWPLPARKAASASWERAMKG